MNRILVIGIITLFVMPTMVLAQRGKKLVDMADNYYKTAQYLPAGELYHEILKVEPNNLHAKYHLAHCQRLLFEYNKAEPLYEQVYLADAGKYPLSLFYFALTQKLNRKYDLAIKSFLKFENESANLSEVADKNAFLMQAKVERKGCELALDQEKMPLRDFQFGIMDEPVNSAFNDYAPVIFEDGAMLVVSSGRAEKEGQIDPRLGEALSNNYRFVWQGSGWLESQGKDKFDKINSRYGDGAGFLVGDKFYYTSCQEDDDGCAIYVSELKKGKWEKPEKLDDNINMKGTDNKQPNLTPSGDTLFFVSNREGGMGKNDLWMSIQLNEKWGLPQNLGPAINTPFNEISPYYHPDENLLFFASDGHYGFGGLDIYMTTGFDLDNIEILNVGLPFNSNADDCYFTLGNTQGYMASNRKNGFGKFDIYNFDKESEETVIAEIADHMPYAHRELAYNDKNFKYFDLSGNGDPLLAQNEEPESYSVSGKLVDKQTGAPIADATVPIVNKNGELLKTTQTNQQGEFRYEDIDKNEDMRILADQQKSSLTSQQKMKVEDLKIAPGKARPGYNKIESIYFDFSSSQLRCEAKMALEDLVDFYRHFPDIQIEIDAHTDNVGNANYNKQLSHQRGKIVYNFLIERGIDASALVINAKGQTAPYASNDNQLGRQLNRRVEFVVKGISDKLSYPTSTFIIKPKANLYRIAKSFDMTVAEVMLLNGFKGKNIKAYSPVRVYNKVLPDDKYVFVPIQHAMINAVGMVNQMELE